MIEMFEPQIMGYIKYNLNWNVPINNLQEF